MAVKKEDFFDDNFVGVADTGTNGVTKVGVEQQKVNLRTVDMNVLNMMRHVCHYKVSEQTGNLVLEGLSELLWAHREPELVEDFR